MDKKPKVRPFSRIITGMIDASGMSASELSRSIGRSRNYLNSMIYNGTMPRVDLFTDIAAACGFEITISGPGVSFVAMTTEERELAAIAHILLLAYEEREEGILPGPHVLDVANCLDAFGFSSETSLRFKDEDTPTAALAKIRSMTDRAMNISSEDDPEGNSLYLPGDEVIKLLAGFKDDAYRVYRSVLGYSPEELPLDSDTPDQSSNPTTPRPPTT